MSGSGQYQVDLESVSALTKTWESASQTVSKISQQLQSVHGRLESAIPTALIDGLVGEVPLAAAFAALAEAAKEAGTLAQGLQQDVASLEQNQANYAKAEAEITAKLKAAQEAQEKAKKAGGPHGGSTVTSGGGGHGGSGGGSGSSGGGSGSGGSGSGGGGGSVQPPGPAHYANQQQVNQWIDEAFKILEANGVPASELDQAGVLLIIEHESGGNPNAINNWDSNAKAGDPSRGLMQTIGTTFDAYKLAGHNDIYNPVDNIIAGVRYALSRYGSIQNVPGVKNVDSGGSYVGY